MNINAKCFSCGEWIECDSSLFEGRAMRIFTCPYCQKETPVQNPSPPIIHVKQNCESGFNKAVKIIRWIAVLPGALFVAAAFSVFARFMPDIIQIIIALITVSTFVGVATKIAPTHKFATSLWISSITSILFACYILFNLVTPETDVFRFIGYSGSVLIFMAITFGTSYAIKPKKPVAHIIETPGNQNN